MLFLRGLVVALGGIAFVFLPGVMVSHLTRRDLRFETTPLLWGMGLLLVTLFPALFLTYLAKAILLGSRQPGSIALYIIAFLSSGLAAIFLEWGKYGLLRWRKIPPTGLLNAGIVMGLGVGLLTNVFQGIALMGIGFQLMLGDTSLPEIVAQPWPSLLLGQIALVVYRLGLVAVSAALGAVVARALIRSERRWVWLAVGINTLSVWLYNATGQTLGSDSLIGSVVIIIYEGVLAVVAMRWLVSETASSSAAPTASEVHIPAAETRSSR